MTTISLILLGLFLILLGRRFIRRSHMFIYVYDELRRYKVRIGYVRGDGTIIDIHNPRGARRIGQVYVRGGYGIVRIYRGNGGEYDEVGYVTPDGEIYTGDPDNPGALVGVINPDGDRKWYELWLILHTEVPRDEIEPYGHCTETGRFRHRKPNEVTLLSRATAALLLYYKTAKPADEPAYMPPSIVWDTALLSSLFFSVAYVPLYYLSKGFSLFPFLGSELSLVFSLFGAYVVLWLILHLVKEYLLSYSDKVLDYLRLLNTNTGLGKWNSFAIVALLVGLIWSVFIKGYPFAPFFAALLVGVSINAKYISGELWQIRPPYSLPVPSPQQVGPEQGTVDHVYEWELDSPLRSLRFSTRLTFDPKEILSIRTSNPFYQNWQEASARLIYACHQIINAGKQSGHVITIARYCIQESIKNSLTPFEHIQAILDFVQEPNIEYKLDHDCEELGGKGEYVRHPAETLYDRRGDCDCKAMLAATLFHAAGFAVLFLVGKDHAAIAVGGAPELDVEGVISWKGKRYYYCETTGDYWTVGKVPGDQMAMIDKEQTIIIEL